MGAVLGMLGIGGGTGGTDVQLNQLYKPEQLQQALQQAQQAYGQAGQNIGMYEQLARGEGPNPALEMLRQQTGQNVANQAALMAGQRGAAGNVGMLARQAANVGSQAQQQAVGQGAQLGAQQQLAAMQNLAQARQQQLQNALSQQQLQQQAGMGYQAIQGGLAEKRMGQQPGAIGGVLQSIGNVVGKMMAAGGEVENPQHLFVGGPAMAAGAVGAPAALPAMDTAALSAAAPTAASSGAGMLESLKQNKSSNPLQSKLLQSSMLGAPDTSPSSVSKYLSSIPKMASGGSVGSALKSGGSVPGRARVAGDSLKNDTVHAMLSPGEVVIPRSVMNSKDPVRGSADFVAALLAKKGMRS